MSVEDLAKAMHDGLSGFDPAVRSPRWDELAGWVQESYRRQARAAREFYGIPEGAQKGAVREAVVYVRRQVEGCTELGDRRRSQPDATCVGCCDEELCQEIALLRTLGEEV